MNQFKKTIQITFTLILFTLFSSNAALAQDGRVGIGTDNPNAKLHVAGDMQVDDLAGEGDRNLVVDEQGKLKAVTNTTPEPSNEDTIRAKFIELIDDEGDTRFIFNANTGEFQMLDNDTTWYELEVNSPVNETIRLDNGKGAESQTTSNSITLGDLFQIADVEVQIENTIDEQSSQGDGNGQASKCLTKIRDILSTDEPTKLQKTTRLGNDGSDIAPPTEFHTFTITTSGESGVNTISVVFEVDHVNQQNNEPEMTVRTASIAGKCQCKFAQESEGETQEVRIVSDGGTKNENIVVFEKKEDGSFSKKESLSSGFGSSDDNATSGIRQVFVNEQDGTSNTQDSKGSTIKNGSKSNKRGAGGTSITDSEKATSLDSGLDADGKPFVQLTDTDKETTIDANGIKQTDKETGELSEASLEDIIKTATDFFSKNEEQDNQINQNKDDVSQNTSNIEQNASDIEQNSADISSLDDRVTEVENNSGSGGGTTAAEFTAEAGGSTNKLKPEEVEISAADGNNAKFKKDGIELTAADLTQLFIDCFGMSKIKPTPSPSSSNGTPSKSLGFAGLSLDADNDKVVVDVDLQVFGTITETGKKVNKMDHPDNPNQYLQHSTMGTAELLNFYNGTVTTNSKGRATVELPSYVQSFNKDFRYQLTVIGGTFAQAIIAQEIENNQFVIRTNEPDVKVSWQITGVRNDVYAQQNPLEVEVNKAGNEVGKLYNSSSKQFNRKVARKMAAQSGEVVGDL